MTVPVRYYCPRCGAIATLERDEAMADKSVTAYPAEGWRYADPEDDIEAADGVRLVCGEHTDEAGCDEPFYLNFVRFDEGVEIEPVPESEYVTINPGPRRPGPRGPDHA